MERMRFQEKSTHVTATPKAKNSSMSTMMTRVVCVSEVALSAAVLVSQQSRSSEGSSEGSSGGMAAWARTGLQLLTHSLTSREVTRFCLEST
jgi:hypothetical protein